MPRRRPQQPPPAAGSSVDKYLDELLGAPEDFSRRTVAMPKPRANLDQPVDEEANNRAWEAAERAMRYTEAVEPIVNPLTKRADLATATAYEEFVAIAFPNLPLELYYHFRVILRCALAALFHRFETTAGRDHEYIAAITLGNWSNSLARLILDKCHDDERVANGEHVLLQLGLHARLRAVTMNIVFDYKLARVSKDKSDTWGRWHVAILVRYLLSSTELTTGNERLVKLSHIVVINNLFYIALRPGTMAPSCRQYLEWDMYPTMKDIQWYLTEDYGGALLANMVSRYSVWKGSATTLTTPTETYTLEPPADWENTMFHASLYMLAYYWGHGAFGDMTIDELVNYKGKYLACIKEFEDVPLFPKIQQGGHDFERPLTATLAKRLSENLAALGRSASLYNGNPTRFRRDAGNDYKFKMDHKFASKLFGHGAVSKNARNAGNVTFRRYYDDGQTHVPLTGIRHGTLMKNMNDPVSQVSLKLSRTLLNNTAIAVILNRNHEAEEKALAAELKDQDDKDNARDQIFRKSNTLNAASREGVLAHPDVALTFERLEDAWKSFLECFPAEAATFQHGGINSSINLGRIMNSNIRPTVAPRKVYKALHKVKDSAEQGKSIRKQTIKRFKKKQQGEEAKSKNDPTRSHNTVKNVKAAEAELDATPVAVITEVTGQRFGPKGKAPAPRGAGSAAAPRADAAIEQMFADLSRPVDRELADLMHAKNGDRPPPGPLPSLADCVLPATDSISLEQLTAWHAALEARVEAIDGEDDLDTETAIAEDKVTMNLVNYLDRRSAEMNGETVPPHHNLVPYGKRLQSIVDTQATNSESSKAPPRQPDNTAQFNITDAPPKRLKVGATDASGDTSNPLDSRNVDTTPGVSRVAVFEAYFRALVYPMQRNRELQRVYEENGNQWLCDRCLLYTHDPDATTPFASLAKVLYHRDVHTDWYDLELKARTDDPDVWQCPSCDFTADTMHNLRMHCINSCEDKDTFGEMLAAHRGRRHARRYAQDSSRRQRMKEMAADDDFQPDTREKEADGEAANLMRERILDFRGLDVERAIQQLEEAGRSTPDQRDVVRGALTTIKHFAIQMYDDPRFYNAAFNFEPAVASAVKDAFRKNDKAKDDD